MRTSQALTEVCSYFCLSLSSANVVLCSHLQRHSGENVWQQYWNQADSQFGSRQQIQRDLHRYICCRQRASSHLICHTAGTREPLYCLHAGISCGIAQWNPAVQPSSPAPFSLALWLYGSTLRTPHFWSTLHFSDNLWDGAKMFQQVKTCVTGDHLPFLRRAHCLGKRAAFLPAGSALVDWLISNSFAVSRFEAVTLASMLMDENFIRPVGVRSTEATRSSDPSEKFLDDSTALYMFVSDAAADRGTSSGPCHHLIWGSGGGDVLSIQPKANVQAEEVNAGGAALGF